MDRISKDPNSPYYNEAFANGTSSIVIRYRTLTPVPSPNDGAQTIIKKGDWQELTDAVEACESGGWAIVPERDEMGAPRSQTGGDGYILQQIEGEVEIVGG